AREAGLEVVHVTGNSKGYGYAPGTKPATNHAWNAVKLDGRWHLIDATWGAGSAEAKKGFVKALEEHWFLTPPDQFVLSHLPTDPARQFLTVPVDEDTYRKWPRVPTALFALGVAGKDVQDALNDRGFRELVSTYSTRGHAVRAPKAPLKKHLPA